MLKRLLRPRALMIAAVAIVGGVLVVRAVLPDAIVVSTATAETGPFAVSIDEDGRTRAVDRYVITAPVAGELEHVPIRAAEPVSQGQVVARIRPLPLDERTRLQLRAALDAALARERAAAASLQQAAATAEQTRKERERRETLAKAGALAEEQLEQFRLAERAAAETLRSADEAAKAASADVQAARAALLGGADASGAAITVRSPASGTVARVPERSSRIVAPGEPLLEVTDPSALEVIVDVLSADAVRIQPGMRATLTAWGGDQPLGATVRCIEPAAFTRISALGVEEQRVNAILDLDRRPPGLGDGFRVEASITVWFDESALTVPSSAVFRAPDGMTWRLFRVLNGRAALTDVQVGERNGARTRILSGVEPGETVILFPSDDLTDGARVRSS